MIQEQTKTVIAALQNGATALISCLVALSIVEAGLQIWDFDRPQSPRYGMNEFDPVIGWVNRPNARTEFSRAEFRYLVENNSIGMRDREIQPKRSDEFRVVFLGDSFTWGWGAAYGERFTEIIEDRNPRINALNCGVSGYSPLQYLLLLDRVLLLNPDYVILAYSLGSDLTDNLVSLDDPAKPYGTLSNDSQLEIIGYPLSPESAEPDPDFHSRVYRMIARAFRIIREKTAIQQEQDNWAGRDLIALVHTPREKLDAEQLKTVDFMYRLNETILGSINARIERAIGPHKLAVFLAPSKYEYGQSLESGADAGAVARGLIASVARLKLPVLDGRDVIEGSDFWPVDGHWNPSGHRKIGDFLERYISDVMTRRKPGPEDR